MTQGKLFILSGPSGVGKGTIIKHILEQTTDFTVAISATTRAPRIGEKEGVDYHFLTKADFLENVEKDAFLEWCEVHSNLYGTLNSDIESRLNEGKNVFVEIDTQGAKKIKKINPSLTMIFIAPPTFQDLFSRLKNRNTEDKAVIQSRLAIAGKELSEIGEYDYVVINQELSQAVTDVLSICRQKGASDSGIVTY